MNRKGFAISTLIYGLAVMGILLIAVIMQYVSSIRSNTKEMSDQIEKELNRYSRASIQYSYSDVVQTYEVPAGATGYYRVQLWGAGHSSGSRGAYTTGIILLSEGDVLYIQTGKKGNGATAGGKTDLKIMDENDDDSGNSTIMSAAGAGNNAVAHGGTICGYGTSLGTSGGGYATTGADRYKPNGNLLGTFKTGYPTDTNECKVPALNESGSATDGGDGYIKSKYSDHGGVSFISGYIGSNAYIDGEISTQPFFIQRSSDEEEGKNESYYFIDSLMLPGVNADDGKATIERIMETDDANATLPNRNRDFNRAKELIDCIAKTDYEANVWKRMEITAKGIYISRTPVQLTDTEVTELGLTAANYSCAKVTLTTAPEECDPADPECTADPPAADEPVKTIFDIDEIYILHKTGKDYKKHIVMIKNEAGEYKTLLKADDISESETINGTRLSAYQPNIMKDDFKNNICMFISILSEGKVISGPTVGGGPELNNPLIVNYYTGEGTQKWSIEKIPSKIRKTDDEVAILDTKRYKAMTIDLDENKEFNTLVANSNFNYVGRNNPQIWKIESNKDGTYYINTSVQALYGTNQTGSLVQYTGDEIIISPIKSQVSRFKLYCFEHNN